MNEYNTTQKQKQGARKRLQRVSFWFFTSILFLLASTTIVLASVITDADFYGIITVGNNSTATSGVGVNCSINTGSLVTQGFLNSGANNCAVQNTSGADVAFMPSVNTSYPWCFFVPSIGAESYLSYLLYTGNVTGGEIRYFPGAGGMDTSDHKSLELGDNFSVEQSGWVDTTYSFTGEEYPSYVEVDANDKLTVTLSRAEAADVDWDEDVYLYTDKGANYFDALDIDFELYIESTSQDDGLGGIAITNTIGDFQAFANTDLSVLVRRIAGPAYRVSLMRGAAVVEDFYVGTHSTLYYCTLYRPAGNDTANVTIFLTPQRATPLDTLLVGGFVAEEWQYSYGFVNSNGGLPNKNFDGYVQNLDLTGQGVGLNDHDLLVSKPEAFWTYISETGNITSGTVNASISTISVTAPGVSSGEHTVITAYDQPFFSLGIDAISDPITPVSDNLVFNAPMWQTELDADPFTTIDDTGYSCNVTGATWTSDGRTFDGVTDFISTNITFTTPYTLSVWAKCDQVPSVRGVGSTLTDSAILNEAAFSITTVDRIYFYNGADILYAVPDPIFTDWHMFTVVVDGASSSITIDDGTPVTGTMSGPSIKTLYFGTNGVKNVWHEGTIGKVQVYDKALTTVEVNQNFYATRAKYTTGNIYTYSANCTVPDNSNDLTFLQNSVMPYMEYQDISVNGTQVQYIDWEYDTTFNDISGYGNDAIPTFRTTSSSANVSADLTLFQPVVESEAPPWSLDTTPSALVSTTVTTTGNFSTTPTPTSAPFIAVIEAVSTATATPSQLPFTIIAGFIILATSLGVTHFMRKNNANSLVIKLAVIITLFGIFIAVDIFDFWMLVFFVIPAIAIIFLKAQGQSV